MGVPAIGAGLSVVSGIASLGSKQAAANAQQKQLDAQAAQQSLQSQLQLQQLKNQTTVNQLNDALTDATNKTAYLQTQSTLAAQQMQTQLNQQNSLFQAGVQGQLANADKTQAYMQAAKQQSDARLAAGAEALNTFAGASTEEQQATQSILGSVAKGEQQHTALAAFLDLAASSGGVNNAVAKLAQSGLYDAETGAANVNRGEEGVTLIQQLAQQAKQGTVGVADAQSNIARSQADISAANAGYQTTQAVNATNAQATESTAGYAAQNAANDANFNIGLLSNQFQRDSRYLSTSAQEEAISKGAVLQQQAFQAQSDAIRSPGLFDYATAGLSGYSTYNSLNQTNVNLAARQSLSAGDLQTILRGGSTVLSD